jgi:hypothetical protein
MFFGPSTCNSKPRARASKRLNTGVSDEDMTLMHTTMIGAWNGVEEVQQGFPSQQGGPRLIRFEYRGGGQKQFKFESSSESRSSAQKNGRTGRIRSRFWTFYIWLEEEFHRASNGSGLMPKFVPSQRESSKQVDVHNLTKCCVDSLVGP